VASVFTKIIAGELPGQFVWKDAHCVAFLSIAPLQPGHTLVVPREEVDHWLDLDPAVVQHMAVVSQKIGKGIMQAFEPVRVGTIVLGLEVPHYHVHVVPVCSPTDLDLHNAHAGAKPEDLAAAAAKLRDALRDLGYAEISD
jgi:diadenosine tetraphosphate (Ap4A) HIT family hydrolase